MSEGLVVVGLNHRTAPVEARERLAVPPDGLEDAVRAVLALDGVREAVVVATCNRVELYAAGAEVAQRRRGEGEGPEGVGAAGGGTMLALGGASASCGRRPMTRSAIRLCHCGRIRVLRS